MPSKSTFKRGCRGPVVVGFQEHLEVSADGIYGRLTTLAVRKLQRAYGWVETGEAGRAEFEALGIQFPDEFLRCLNLTSAMEGTGFSDVNVQDIDGWGITLGVIGFTSRNGEVQRLFSEFLKLHPHGMDGMMSEARVATLKNLIHTGASYKAWDAFAYAPNKYIRSDFEAMVDRLGRHPDFRNLQVRFARKTYWEPAIATAAKLGVKSMAGRGLLYDGYVQSGGWRQDHQKFLDSETKDGTEKTLLRAIARAFGYRATKRWQHDVLKRKLLFVETAGVVHGLYLDLDDFAFDLD